MRAHMYIFLGTILALFLLVLPTIPIWSSDIFQVDAKEVTKADHLVINEVFYGDDDANKWWIELYNPSDSVYHAEGIDIWFSSIYGPQEVKTGDIKAYEFIILCASRENFTSIWKTDARIFQIQFGQRYDAIRISTLLTENKVERTLDKVPESGKFSNIEKGHSWARYRGAYSMDNFTNDFYDEPSPTPGYENHRAKYNKENPADVWIYGMGTATVLVIAIAVIYRFKKRR